MRNSQRIGLAFSGGGSRAIAFHLGCMKALDQGGLRRSHTKDLPPPTEIGSFRDYPVDFDAMPDDACAAATNRPVGPCRTT